MQLKKKGLPLRRKQLRNQRKKKKRKKKKMPKLKNKRRRNQRKKKSLTLKNQTILISINLMTTSGKKIRAKRNNKKPLRKKKSRNKPRNLLQLKVWPRVLSRLKSITISTMKRFIQRTRYHYFSTNWDPYLIHLRIRRHLFRLPLQ